MNITELKTEVASSGSHFFEPATMRFFASRLPKGAMNITESYDKRRVYFITSERFDAASPRLFSVRMWDRDKQQHETIGEFQAHKSELDAQRAMFAAVNAYQAARS